MDDHLSATTEVQSIPPDSVPAQKFAHPVWTAKGERRAVVAFKGFETLWFNTGTLCNIACENCYIESSPRNDALIYLTRAEVKRYLDEAATLPDRPAEIGFTGGEPFMNPDMLLMLEDCLAADFRCLVLTNAMRPMMKCKDGLLALHRKYPDKIALRVSLDHYEKERHEAVRGPRTWEPPLKGLRWLSEHKFPLAIAGRKLWDEDERSLRAGYQAMLTREGIAIDASKPDKLVLFPEMQAAADVPEISEGCWAILKKHPDQMMCATSRMVIKRKGEAAPTVAACTLLPYDAHFDMGGSLAGAKRDISLKHRHCAKFCVLGGASCSPTT